MNIKQLLSEKVSAAMVLAGLPEGTNPAVSLSSRPNFGDYQANGVMGAAKKLKTNPRELATKVVEHLDLEGIADNIELAGPGFINIHLDKHWLAAQLAKMVNDEKLGVTQRGTSPEDQAKTVVVDYSAPNLAKEMHVGHLRSTIIGDAVVRALEFRGDKVIRQNHMGDWGTQFGMLLAHLSDKLNANEVAETALSDLENFYREAKIRFDNEEGFADRARDYVVKLQGGDKDCLVLWKLFIDISIVHSEDIYQKLNVTLTRDDIMGESAYNNDLPTVVEELMTKGIAEVSEGAKVVFINEMANKDGDAPVFIIQKTGGGYLYATTDLSACRYRTKELKADRIIIFTDARQSLHFKQVEIVARKSGLLPAHVGYDHCPFGMMMGDDGKPFKTRTGGTIKLAELLDEAVIRAKEVIKEKNPDYSDQQLNEIATKVGIGAVKFADLSKNRTSDYIFNWKTMLSFEGATAPYLQYAYSRIQSIFNKAQIEQTNFNADISIIEPQEKALALKLLQLEEVIDSVISESTPNLLCNYLYELASLYMSFYEACPILKEGIDEAVKKSRLALCLNISKTLKQGLDILGIEVMERM
ncbi:MULTISPECIES: arginine--tRNA ligase [unclassified Colwellia]|uniref:arginine--tRNA ligase n=1 Tax=unclassified Colwellia TaxID=196834 RepID=UPI0015F5CC98|nr:MULTISPECIES: arginine--tRNA ligase [unclassified Colwellia]MBA6230833.1 arginine--tRNA ligase [Colwellia sp. MB02u-7]MBA6234764.1 arginine--tRNA ligase [Colwellia sp. MB02u-11]MBA6255627.1 arginine--tRNA ligase [Colwellia sp. MB3u-28]MBA6261768.1 arginine--tRNA ligase [Colwellia sp. MB3u-41]MBA6301319.1 arginine--tRNA ligase [Colwellia sp. MB3u-22]